MSLPTGPGVSEAVSDRIDMLLQQGVTVLTPTARAARHLSSRYDQRQREAGVALWQPANVLPWRAWAASLWQGMQIAGVEQRVLLNSVQEHALWIAVLQAEHASTLRTFDSLARLCSGALQLLGEYDTHHRFARASLFDHAASADVETFARWYARFQTICEDAAYLPTAFLDLELAHAMRERRVIADGSYLLYGFDLISPAKELVIEILRQQGAAVEIEEAIVATLNAPSLMDADSPEDELLQCARWVRKQLEAQPARRVAVLVPDLAGCRAELERTLRTVVAPELADLTATGKASPFEYSTGRPLAALPLMKDAMRMLRWCAGPISLEDAGALLRSPWLGIVATPERGAELDAFRLRDAKKLRQEKVLRAEISMGEVAALLYAADRAAADQLRALQRMAVEINRNSDTFANHADRSRKLLKHVAWAPLETLSSEEFQAVDRWNEALDQLATLDLVRPRVSFQEFIASLETISAEMLFAPENQDAPVQIMTVTEAAGSTADSAWFLHADEKTWPPRSTPHPLLPWTLQRQLGMPGMDTTRDDAVARRVVQRVATSAGETVFSYAAHTADGEQRVSSTVATLQGLTRSHAVEQPDQDTEDVPALEQVDDVAPLPSLPAGVLKGGVGILTSQAQCGFRAFAEKRLFSSEMDTVDAGLSAGDRGEQVHTALQLFWQEVKTHAALRSLMTIDEDGVSARDALLLQCVDQALGKMPDAGWGAAYLRVQRKRLMKLLGDWLNFEATRPPFEVTHIEWPVPDAKVGPLHIELRVDRVDKIEADGEEAVVLIDYKTGSGRVERSQWVGERLDQPQLPTYAIAGGIEGVNGIAFGTVKVGKGGMKLDGLAYTPKLLGGGRSNFDYGEELAAWQDNLPKLAQDFADGIVDVDPKEYPTTCDLCSQRMLCRLDAAALLDAEEEDDEDEVMFWA